MKSVHVLRFPRIAQHLQQQRTTSPCCSHTTAHAAQRALVINRRAYCSVNTARAGLLRRAVLPLFSGVGCGLACGTAVAVYWPVPPPRQQSPALQAATGMVEAVPGARSRPAWVHDLARRRGILAVFDASDARARHPLLGSDHMFTALVRHELVSRMSCYYHPEDQHFFSAVCLGEDICGYTSIVHGGLTAAIFDETFGGLLFALKKQCLLPFWGPAFTAQLDITYRGKISSMTSILCSAEVESIEGRKVWMRAVMSDGPDGRVYATARALFVAPKPQKLLREGISMLLPFLSADRRQ